MVTQVNISIVLFGTSFNKNLHSGGGYYPGGGSQGFYPGGGYPPQYPVGGPGNYGFGPQGQLGGQYGGYPGKYLSLPFRAYQ